MDRFMSSSTGSSVPTFQFSTKTFAQHEQLTALREIFGRTVCNLDIDPLEPAAFSSEASVYQFPGLGVMFAACGGMKLTHSHELIVDGDLSFMAAPTCRFVASQLGRTVELEAGAGVLMTNAEVGSIVLSSSSRFVTFRVPREAMALLVPDVEAAVAQPVPPDNLAFELLVDYLQIARDREALTSPDLQRIAVTHICDLLAVALGATSDATEIAHGRGMRAARLRSAKAFIARNFRRQDLSPDWVAKELGISARYLHMLFETEGLSFTRFVVEYRLAYSHRMLLDSRMLDRTISAIAFAAGFSDLSHFNRTFRQHFGKTPTDVRRCK
jgi:AraC-like DNA-binding protein